MKRTLPLFALAMVLIIVGVVKMQGQNGQFVQQNDRGDRDERDDDDDPRIRIGFAIAPVPLNLRGKNRSLVGLGATSSTRRRTARAAIARRPTRQAAIPTLESRRRSARPRICRAAARCSVRSCPAT